MPQKTLAQLNMWITTALLTLTDRLDRAIRPAPQDENDRGDVPGWVMITVMTSIVTLALLTVFRDQVKAAVTNAFEAVSGAAKT